MTKHIGQIATLCAWILGGLLYLFGAFLSLWMGLSGREVLVNHGAPLLFAAGLAVILALLSDSDLRRWWNRLHDRNYWVGPGRNPWISLGCLINVAAVIVMATMLLELEIGYLFPVVTTVLLFAIPYVFGCRRHEAYCAILLVTLLACGLLVRINTIFTISGCVFVTIAAIILLIMLDSFQIRSIPEDELPRGVCVALSILTLLGVLGAGVGVYVWNHPREMWHHMALMKNPDIVRLPDYDNIFIVVKDAFGPVASTTLYAVGALFGISLVISALFRFTATGRAIGLLVACLLIIPAIMYLLSRGVAWYLDLPGLAFPMMSMDPLVNTLHLVLLILLKPHYWFSLDLMKEEWFVWKYQSLFALEDEEEEEEDDEFEFEFE